MSKAEETFAWQLRTIGGFVREYRFHPVRRWRFDFANPENRLAVEVEGGVFVNGRHTRGAAFEKDAEKYNTATIMGWRVLRVTPRHVKTGQALAWVEEAMKGARND